MTKLEPPKDYVVEDDTLTESESERLTAAQRNMRDMANDLGRLRPGLANSDEAKQWNAQPIKGEEMPLDKYTMQQKFWFWIYGGIAGLVVFTFMVSSWTIIRVSDNSLESSRNLQMLTSQQLASQIKEDKMRADRAWSLNR